MGREMANLIVDRTTSIDMFGYDINRFQKSYVSNDDWRHQSTHESELRTYWVKFPTLQKMSGRNMRLGPLHQRLSEAGAFFGNTGGFERPLFYLKDVAPCDLKVRDYDFYGYYGHQKHKMSVYEDVLKQEYAKWSFSKRVSGAIRQEVQKCRNSAVIFDLSSFGKVRRS
jgi:sarcosine dehydrogenase